MFPNIDMVYIKVVVLNVIYNFVVNNPFIWDCLDA